MVASVYTIWKARNCLIFQEKCVNVEEVFRQIREIVVPKHLNQFSNEKEGSGRFLLKWFMG